MMGKRSSKQNPRRTRATQASGDWWNDAEEAPRAGLPDAAKILKRQKLYRMVVWSCLLLTPLAMLTVFINLAGNARPDTVPAPARDTYAQTRPDAIAALNTWLHATPAPVPGGEFLAWVDAETTTSPKPTNETAQTEPYRVETHTMTVSSTTGYLYESTVTLAVSKSGGTTVLAEPSLVPRAPGGDGPDTQLWPRLEQTSASGDVEAAITSWAAAYSSGDPVALGQSVGDKTLGHTYVPLVGAKLSDISVSGAAKKGDQLVVAITAALNWDGAPVEDGTTVARVAYDLLIKDPATAAPVVIAWGGPGTGPTLKAGTNAITGRDFTAGLPDTSTSTAASDED